MNQAARQPRVLVVFYSRTGNTLRVALRLTRLCSADLEVIQDSVCRHGLRGYLRSAYEAKIGKEPRIRELQHDPRDYDVVILATPSWNASVSTPIRAYLSRYSSVLPDVAFIATLRGRGASRTLLQMSALAGKSPLATLALTAREIRQSPGTRLQQFHDSLLRAWSARQIRAEEPPGLADGRAPDHGATPGIGS